MARDSPPRLPTAAGAWADAPPTRPTGHRPAPCTLHLRLHLHPHPRPHVVVVVVVVVARWWCRGRERVRSTQCIDIGRGGVASRVKDDPCRGPYQLRLRIMIGPLLVGWCDLACLCHLPPPNHMTRPPGHPEPPRPRPRRPCARPPVERLFFSSHAGTALSALRHAANHHVVVRGRPLGTNHRAPTSPDEPQPACPR